MTSLEIVRLINREDQKVARAVAKEANRIARIIDEIVERLRLGGRVFYVGAGTSGRLGVLDATEMPPTFGVSSKTFQGIIAGGWKALRMSIERAEDDQLFVGRELKRRGFCERDVLIGLSASGKTPFVLAAMRAARQIGGRCFGITCNQSSRMASLAHETVVLRVGPEAVAGSSRMKCGTGQKMVLNMISTGSMIRLGRVYEGLMIDMQSKSRKLKRRAALIISEIARVDKATAERALRKARGSIRLGILSLGSDISTEPKPGPKKK
jgi:N-acetylmuramic acid 6-phosphate etherase